MLAYETVQKCKEDLISYKLTIQSVPLIETDVNNTSSSSSSSSSSRTSIINNNNNSSKKNLLLNSNKTTNSKQLFEDVLDCKSCNIQF